MKKIFCFFILLIVIFLSFSASAHSGKTDSDGGHWDNNTGEYHYHHGYPAHQHTNGECPYDFKDNIKHTEKSNYNYNYSYTTTTATTTANKSSSSDADISETIYLICAVSVFLSFALVEFFLLVKNKEKYQKEKNRLSHEKEEIKRKGEKEAAELHSCIDELTNKLSDSESEKEKYKSLYQKYLKLSENYSDIITQSFNFKNIHDILPLIPENTSFLYEKNTYLPRNTKKPGKYGSYTVYRSRNGCVYHFLQGCSGAHNELNYINIKNYDFMFCKKCSSYMSSEMELCELWAEDFEYLMNLVKDKDITIDFSEKGNNL